MKVSNKQSGGAGRKERTPLEYLGKRNLILFGIRKEEKVKA